MTEEILRERARNHLLKCNGDGSWWAVSRSDLNNQLYLQSKMACYAALTADANVINFVGLGYYCDKDDEAGQNYFKFITSPDESPWRAFMKDEFELIKTNEGHMRGFFFGDKTLRAFNNQKLLKNFMIATRTWNEFPEHINFWNEAIKQGVDKYKAIIMAESFAIFRNEKKIRHTLVHNLNHWPFASDIDIKKIVEGRPTPNRAGTNSSFSGRENNSTFVSYEYAQNRYNKHTPANVHEIADWNYIKKIEPTYIEGQK